MTEKNTSSFRPDIFAREAQKASGKKGLPPVHLWNPEFCGDIDMHIKRDGSWDYMGSSISRPAMVKLFSTILRHDDDGKYYLVTPVEKVGIRVDDAPFVAVELQVEGAGKNQILHFRTNVDDVVVLDEAHPLHLEFSGKGEPSPYILVRDRLEALISRSVYYELANMVEMQDGRYGIWSSGTFFPLEAAK
ncbi:MAG: proteophosphoglycan precursor [Alphaproteobacteria bacterium]|nr:MAG: proteophosphoglycan precursor [Alphaproteobacteria bacterium]